jgi:hypothetical protein
MISSMIQKNNGNSKITDEIAIIWNIEDVQSIRPDLTDYQASDVLNYLKDNHDANSGINWGTIEVVTDNLFPIVESITYQPEAMECLV